MLGYHTFNSIVEIRGMGVEAVKSEAISAFNSIVEIRGEKHKRQAPCDADTLSILL